MPPELAHDERYFPSFGYSRIKVLIRQFVYQENSRGPNEAHAPVDGPGK